MKEPIKDQNNLVAFPVLNISVDPWIEDDIDEYLRQDDLFIGNRMDLYETIVLNNQFVDTNGDVFRVTGVELLLGGILSKFFKKRRLLFTPIDRRLKFSEVKRLLLNRIAELPSKEGASAWIEALSGATTIRELLEPN